MSRDDRLLPEVTALAGVASAVVSDVLDRMGRRDRVLDPAIRPLWPEARFVGVAVPVVIVADSSEPELPYDGELTALDGLRPGDVPMFAVESGVRAASWGELFSCAAIGRGAAGVVVDGLVRDAAQITALGFPTFARGLSPLDTFGRAVVTDIDVEAVVGSVEVTPGDLVVGDVDGIVADPARAGGRGRRGGCDEAPARGERTGRPARGPRHSRGVGEVRRPLAPSRLAACRSVAIGSHSARRRDTPGTPLPLRCLL